MMTPATTLAMIMLAGPPDAFAAHAGDQVATFQAGLDLAEVDWDDFRFDEDVVAVWGGDKWRVPLFTLFFNDPWKASPYGREHAGAARAAAPSLHDLLYLSQANTGIRVRNNYYASFLTEASAQVEADGDLALARALANLGDVTVDEIRSTPGYDNVPAPVASAVAVILRVVADAEAYRKLALLDPLEREGFDLAAIRERVYEELFWRAADDDDANLAGDAKFAEVRRMLDTERMLDAIDFHLLARGSNLIALATDAAMTSLTEADLPTTPFDVTFPTRLGSVHLCGGRDDHHPDDHCLLRLDVSGDDHHSGGAATGQPINQGISILIDLAGQDTYETPGTAAWKERLFHGPAGGEDGFRQETPEDHQPAFAAGVMGYAYLVDAAGDDRYTVPIGGLGCGLLGHAAHLDQAGNDQYEGDTGAMGCGIFGTGTSADLGGQDRYRLLHKGMGYGGTRGSGVLVNLQGDDEYLADVDHIKYSWFDSYGTQLNMTQGFGYGRRADMDDGHSWAGGVGMLVDGGEGNDRYQCGIYGIGCAYWYALGLLHDDGGDDEYSSDSYSIASPPHFAVGIVIDEAGDDIWRGKSSRACGFGRDFALGWFEDGGGDDWYFGSDSAFGVGNVNGLGVCWDRSGNDTWVARSNSFGQPYQERFGTRRDFPINVGLFIDGGGTDRYLKLPEGLSSWDLDRESDLSTFDTWEFLGDGARHSWRDHIDQPGASGAAVDAP
ncbi:MAG: hypothetical protein MK116_07285 [Phycisphaerales bacterium]|nr:hypothetical protein [Phycisphaerales bacterium]